MRRRGERISIGDDIEIYVSRISNTQVGLAIKAIGHKIVRPTKEQDERDRGAWIERKKAKDGLDS
jgi:sRNA-binding carbon storage regulator CsrA